MTKKQVLFSLRERINKLREDSERRRSCNVLSERKFYAGRIDCCDLVLEMLCDYD